MLCDFFSEYEDGARGDHLRKDSLGVSCLKIFMRFWESRRARPRMK
jgi:hypothetical protein